MLAGGGVDHCVITGFDAKPEMLYSANEQINRSYHTLSIWLDNFYNI